MGIIPGVSIEGIRFGDSRARVEEVLGKLDQVGWVDGVWRTWRAYYYSRKNKSGAITVDFIDNFEEYGPVDKVVVGLGYEGKTIDGIGIGSVASEVERLWGPPTKTIGNEYIWYANYCIGSKYIQFVFKNNTAISIGTGFFIPCPADTFDTCY